MTTITADRAPMAGMKVYHLKLGMWVFLLSEVMFFTGLIGAYVILRFAQDPVPQSSVFMTNSSVPFPETVG